ncbi:MAG: hypothetical protein IKO86_07860 [Prevotella sp.]|nr:hypothetical protein [Prevotella sp.]
MTQDMVKMMSQDKMIGKREILSSSPSLWFSRFLRTMLLLLMLTLGVGEIWGQTPDPDYSGTYYIAMVSDNADPANNYYLCPTENWISYAAKNTWTNGDDQPFLTTYQIYQDNNYDVKKAKWTLEYKTSENNIDYYYIKHSSGKFLVLNDAITGVSGNNASNRIRVHLQTTFSSEETNKALFTIVPNNGNYLISPKNTSDWYFSVNKGNGDPLTGEDRNSGGSVGSGANKKGLAGTIGIYNSKTDPNSYCFFKDVISAPVITQQNNNTITITYSGTGTLYYTTEGSRPDPEHVGDDYPTQSTTQGTTTISMTNPVTTVRAVVVKTKDTDETLDTYSRFVSLTTQFYIGNQYKYLLQSKECQFYYMIPSVNNTLNTLNVPCKEMAWYLESAGTINGTQYYYINNAQDGRYIYNNNDNLALNATNGETDTYMFSIAGSAEDGYSLTSKNRNKQVFKASIGTNAVSLKTDATSQALWNIIAYTGRNSLPQWETTPFTASTNDGKYYYQIKSRNPIKNGEDDVFIVLNSSDAIKCEVLPTEQKKALWVIKNVGHDTDNLLDYYTLQNAYTSELLYYTGVGQGIKSAASQMGQPSEGDETWSHFVIVQTASTSEGVVNYNIIPRAIIDNVKSDGTPKHAYNCLNRADGGDVIGTWYDDGNSSRWTFVEQTDVPCASPLFTETDPGTGKVITLTLPIADSATDIYFTDDGTDPTDVGITPTKYTDQSWPSSTQKFIKAFAKLKNDNTGGSISSVVTLFNNPDVTLSQDTYTYKGAAQTPTISEVSITINEVKTTAASDTYEIDEYVNNTNVGLPSSENPPTVKLKDVAGDDWYIWNASKTFTIAPKAVTITAKDGSKTYDSTALTESGFTPSALENGDTHTFSIAMTEGSTITNVGTQSNVIATVDGVAVTTGTETTVGNYLVTTANGTLTINPKAVTITAKDASKTYNGTALTEGGFAASDLEAGDTHEFTVAMTEGSTITNAGTQSNVIATVDGFDVTTGTAMAVGNYLVTTVDGTLTINPKAVTITAINASKLYDGTALTEGGFSATALEEGDTHTFTVAMTEGSTITNAGTQSNVIATVDGVAVTTGTATEVGNYSVTTADGTLTITGKEITISGITAENKVYNGTTDAVLVYTGVTFTGKLDGDDLTVTATGTFDDKNVGTGKTVTITGFTFGGTDAANYTYNGGDLTATADITPASVTVTAENKTKGYGDDDPELTWTVDGLKGTDTKDVLTVSMSRTEGEDVGTTITITPSGHTEQGNYTVSYVTGMLTITPKAIGNGTTPAEDIDIDITYDGTDYTVTVKQGENELQQGEDKAYTWTGADGSTDTYVVTITGQNNYTSSAQATYIKQTFYDTTPDQVLATETTAAVYCATQNLKVNDTFEAYYVTKLENNSLTITKVEAGEGENKKNYIPEGQPVLLISETNPAPKGFTLKPYTGTGTDLVTIPETGEGANLLKVVTDDGGKDVNLEEVYIFSMGEFVLNKAGTMSKGKFYLENPDYNTSAHSRSVLSITSGDVTGINTFQLSDTDSQIPDIWYTIGGQKLHKKPTRKGIYLQNGKKVVIK